MLSWRDDLAILTTNLSKEQLSDWLLNEYQPTPITSPWNGGSGYFPNDKSAKKALERIAAEETPRFEAYRKTLQECRKELEHLGLRDKPEPKIAKPRLMRALRSNLTSPEALEWLDAACVIGDEDRLEMVPLLGTGGNDGRLDLSSNYAQNLVELLLCSSKQRGRVEILIRQALFDESCKGLEKTAIGQYAPGSAGGPNTTSGFDGNPNVNPWDFVLALEGSMVFSAAATRRLGDDSQGFSLPFTVDPSMGGHSAISSNEADKARCEMWLPTWGAPISWLELKAVFAEGRAQVGGRQAANGVDFARAVASLGVERGFQAFERYTFLVRNGKSYFATPAGRYRIRGGGDRRAVDLLNELDPWLRRYRRKIEAHGGATVRSLFRQLDDTILGLCRGSGSNDLMPILRVLGSIHRQLGKMPKLHQRNTPELYVAPLPRLSEAWWPAPGYSSELRLAMAVRGLQQVREFIEPITKNNWQDESRNAIWSKDRLPGNLTRLLKRRFIYQPVDCGNSLTGLALQRWRFGSRTSALVRPEDIENFLYERTDDSLIEANLLGLLLVRLPNQDLPKATITGSDRLPIDYCKLKVAFSPYEPRDGTTEQSSNWLAPSTIVERLAANQPDGLMECDRFLIGKSWPPALKGRNNSLDPPRLAASLAIPISRELWRRLVNQAFPKADDKNSKENAHVH